jgi:hypothetical protein
VETLKQVEPVKELPTFFTLRVMLVGQPDYIMLSVPMAEHDRVMKIVQDCPQGTFLLVECTGEVVAIQLEDLALINFCIDFGTESERTEDEQRYEIQLYLKGRTEPVAIEVDPDRLPTSGNDDGGGQLYNLLCMLEASEGEPDATHFLEDGDGEPVIIMERNLAMVRIPACLIPTWPDGGNQDSDLEDQGITPEE